MLSLTHTLHWITLLLEALTHTPLIVSFVYLIVVPGSRTKRSASIRSSTRELIEVEGGTLTRDAAIGVLTRSRLGQDDRLRFHAYNNTPCGSKIDFRDLFFFPPFPVTN